MNYFLVFLIDFFIFLIQIQIWIFGPVATAGYCYRTPAVAAVTVVYRAVTVGKKTLLAGARWLAWCWFVFLFKLVVMISQANNATRRKWLVANGYA
jgi:hypothetical protein